MTHTGMQGHMHHHTDTGYGTPHGSMSGLLSPDLDLPLDFDALDDLPSTDGLRGFPAPSHPPSAVTPHTHHYTQQQHHHPSQPPPLQSAYHPQGVCACVCVCVCVYVCVYVCVCIVCTHASVLGVDQNYSPPPSHRCPQLFAPQLQPTLSSCNGH